MTTRNLTIVESDLSGRTDAATITFALGDTWYEIDLTSDEEAKLVQSLQGYIKAGRKAAPKKPGKKPYTPDTTPEEREVIRAWAVKNNYEIADRGRIPKKIQAAYDSAHDITRH